MRRVTLYIIILASDFKGSPVDLDYSSKRSSGRDMIFFSESLQSETGRETGSAHGAHKEMMNYTRLVMRCSEMNTRRYVCRLLLELGGGGNSGTPPPEPLDDAPEDKLDRSPSRLVVGSTLPVSAFLARPGMDMEKVWPSLRL
jgi:hypothetical protein